mmetsp:Transcript_52206/g.46891  ORF Transcript_52206/g.46891 Transcript_52206/m.46891 type:complete len:419 (-) Transcript_52206:93-1349(-)
MECFLLLTSIVLITLLPVMTADFTYQSDGDTYWKSTSPFHTNYNQTYGSIISRTATYITFKIIIHNDATIYQRQSMFRIGSQNHIGSANCNIELPSFGIDNTGNKFQLTLQDKDCQGSEYVDDKDIIQTDTYDIHIHFNQQWLFYGINQTIISNNTRTFATSSETLTSDLSVSFFGYDKEHGTSIVNASLYDVIIVSYDQHKPFPQSLLESITTINHPKVVELPYTDLNENGNEPELTPSPISIGNDTDEDIPTTSQIFPGSTRFVTDDIFMGSDDLDQDDGTSTLNEKYVIAGAVFLVIVICVVIICYIYANKSDEKEMIDHVANTSKEHNQGNKGGTNMDSTCKPVGKAIYEGRIGSIVNENKDHKVQIIKLKFDRVDSEDTPRQDLQQDNIETNGNGTMKSHQKNNDHQYESISR